MSAGSSFAAAFLHRVALAACAWLLAACTLPASQGGSAKLALVIGNAAYENAPALKNPVNDAADMCAALRRVGFRTLCHTDVRDRASFDALVQDYVQQLGPNTVGVVYYSGHGVQVGGANFLIPTQVQLKSASEDPLRVLYGLDLLFDRLRQKPTRLQFVVLDACRTDLFAAAPPPTAAPGRGPGVARQPALLRALEATGRAGSGLAAIQDAPPGTMVLYATAARDAAFDGDGRNGPLTKHILRHIGTHGLTVEEFSKRVTVGVETETERDYRRRQTPFTYGSFGGRFCFAGCADDSPVPPSF